MKAVEKILLHASTKVENKVATWVVGVFPNEKDARTFAGMLKVAYNAKDEKSVRRLDKHAPLPEKGLFTDAPRFSMSKAQYAPEPGGLDDELTLS